MTAPGIVVAAPASGSGKTVLTLGLLRHLHRNKVKVASAKAGPDYIDPAFHEAASGRPCPNLDPWAMAPRRLAAVASQIAQGVDLVVCEGVMGLFDGATAFQGSTADLAATLGWPVVLVVDARAQGASAAALVRGFASHRPDMEVAGVVFNRVAGERHARLLAESCAAAVPQVKILGFMPRFEDLSLPGRHLGLVQAVEHPDLDEFLDRAGELVGAHVDVATLRALARPATAEACDLPPPVPPLGQRIGVAADEAFAFRYPLVLEGWRKAGAEISFFSPLGDQAPPPDADALYLPGGYPELHAEVLAANRRFLDGLQEAARTKVVFGECGGYMVLGRTLTDGNGRSHAMAGLLPLATNFAERRLHLGYRRAVLQVDGPLGEAGTIFLGHEFHYSVVREEGPGQALFRCTDAEGTDRGPAGLAAGRVAGSFIHLIDREA
ncbi:MAG: cobyrinate a,c-diamide synthase [Magnetospirillum sp. WYHS-4]